MKVATVVDGEGRTRLAGAIALTTMKLKAPETPSSTASSSSSSTNNKNNRGLLPSHELLEQVDNNTRGAYILLLAVYPKYRHNEIGHDLLREAVSEIVSIADSRRAVENGNTQVVSSPESLEERYDFFFSVVGVGKGLCMMNQLIHD